MEPFFLEDLDEVDLILTELEISQGKGKLILCTVASPAYRDRVIQAIKRRFPIRVMAIENGDKLIYDLRSLKPDDKEVLIWTLPEMLSKDILDALNNFRELFYDNGVPSLVFMTPSALDEVIWKAPDFWRYRGGYHILKGSENGSVYQAVEALSTPFDFSYQNKEELLRRRRINEYLLDKVSDKRARVGILSELGNIHCLLSETCKAIDYYQQALQISREIGDRRFEGANLGNLGAAYADLSDPLKAIEHYQQALTIAREIGDRRFEGANLGNLGIVYANLGESRKAIEHYQQALTIAREIGDRRFEGANLGNLGTAYAALGEPRKAIEHFEQAFKISREIGDRRGEGAALGNLGTAYANLGEPLKAVEHYQQALTIARKIGDRQGEGNALWNKSLALAKLGERTKAIEWAKAALSVFESIESPHSDKIKRKLHEWETRSNVIE